MTHIDELAGVLFSLDTGTLTTRVVTARITRAVVEWAAGRGWATRTEARVEVGEGTRLGYLDVVVLRTPSLPDLAIEIDSADKPWSVDKLRHAAAAGMDPIWVRWGDNQWAGTFEDVDVIQLPVTRRVAPRVKPSGQMGLWT